MKLGLIPYENEDGYFMQEEQFDHSPALLAVYPIMNEAKKLFKYYTMWRLSNEFTARVNGCWNRPIIGSKMFVVSRKLKLIKKELQELNKLGFNDIQATELQAHHDMVNAQSLMHENLGNEVMADAEIEVVNAYKLKHKAY